jgi:hypothetical protein
LSKVNEKYEEHNEEYLKARSAAADAAAEKLNQEKGQIEINKNGMGPLYFRAVSVEKAALLKAEALEKLIKADEDSIEVIKNQLQLLTEQQSRSKAEFERLKGELTEKLPRYIPLGYGDLKTKLKFIYESFKENQFNLSYPLGAMLFILFIDSFSILTVLCVPPKHYPVILETIHNNELKNTVNGLAIDDQLVTTDQTQKANEAAHVAIESQQKFLESLQANTFGLSQNVPKKVAPTNGHSDPSAH